MGTSGRTNGPGKTAAPQKTNLTPAQGAQQAEKRLGKPCYFTGQRLVGIYACVTCQFRINNRSTLPSCPDCGEIIWCYVGDGPRPIPEGEPAAPPAPSDAAGPVADEDVVLPPPARDPVKVEEGINLEM